MIAIVIAMTVTATMDMILKKNMIVMIFLITMMIVDGKHYHLLNRNRKIDNDTSHIGN